VTPVYAKIKDDLQYQTQTVEGTRYFVVKEPISGKFIRLREPEYTLLGYLDGNHSPAEAAEYFERTFHQPITAEAVEQFVAQLERLGFVEGKAAQPSRRKSVLFIKLKAFNPERLLGRLYPSLKWLFSQPALVAQVVLIVLGAVVFFSNLSEFSFNLIELISAANIIVAIASFFLLVTLHEFAHALTCIRFGGKVSEMGFLLLYFQPCFYCNLSDAYLFKNKRERIIVNLAGVWFQTVAWAVFTILWRLTQPEYFLNQVFYLTAAVSLATLIFNLNPAIKLDGYYLLADYVEIPNLRQKTFTYLWNRIKSKLLGCQVVELTTPTEREAKIYRRYGFIAVLYSTLLIGFVLYRGAELMIKAWKGIGFVLFLVLVSLIFRRPVARMGRALGAVWRERKAVWMRPKRLIFYAVGLLVIIFLCVFVKVTRTTGGQARLLSAESYVVKELRPGLLEATYKRAGVEQKEHSQLLQLSSADPSVTQIIPYVTIGDQVGVGDTLLLISSTLNAGLLAEAVSELKRAEADRRLLLSDPKLEEIAKKEAEVKQAEAAYESARLEYNRHKELHSRDLISDDELEKRAADFNMTYSAWQAALSELELLKSAPKAEEIEKIDAEIEKLEARRDYLQAQAEATTVTSPIVGRIVSARVGSELFHLARLESLLVEINMPESDLDITNPGDPVRLRVAAYPGHSFNGEVIQFQLGSELIARALVANQGHTLMPGMTGHAKIVCGKTPLGSLIIRKVSRFFRLEVWSWF
jgi:putative peptide zinc metalloprotease protein